MNENLYRPQLWLVALAALALAGCSSSAGSTHTASESPTPVAAPTVTVTATSAPAPAPVTVTAPASAPAPAPAPMIVVQAAANGPASFRSPSGNINCSLSNRGGDIAARCEVVQHTWAAPPREPECHLNWGDRFELTQGNDAAFDCYGQEFPATNETLAYGQTRSFGLIICDSEATGMTCTDTSTGHYFRVSRDGYELG